MPEPRCDVCTEPGGSIPPPTVDGEPLADPALWARHLECEHPSRVGFGPAAARLVLAGAEPDMATHARPAP